LKCPIEIDPFALELEERIGNGCFGEIWKARINVTVDDRQISDVVAIKEPSGKTCKT